MNRPEALAGLLSLTLITVLCGGCGPKPHSDEPVPPLPTMEPETAEAAPSEPADWTMPAEPAVEPLSVSELHGMAADFNHQGVLQMVFFDTDRSELLPEARQVLTVNAAWLRAHPEFAVLVSGHCDERNTEEYNLALGERRAEAVRKYLAALGVTETRIETISFGEERPLDPGSGEAAWAKNRRAEFEVKALDRSDES